VLRPAFGLARSLSKDVGLAPRESLRAIVVEHVVTVSLNGLGWTKVRASALSQGCVGAGCLRLRRALPVCADRGEFLTEPFPRWHNLICALSRDPVTSWVYR
jgi:hypothetical protein